MNRTKIEWTDWSWNPITGCLHGCWYCYARRIATRFPKNFPKGFKPTFWPERLNEPWQLKKPSKIFVCSMSDLFAPWTPKEWRDAVLKSIIECPIKHTFQLLTKNPERIEPIKFPDNVWVGTTVTCTGGDYVNIEKIKYVRAGVRFVSFEPLLGKLPDIVDFRGIDWIIVGKLTGSKKIPLDEESVLDILTRAEWHDIPVFLKNNLGLDHLSFTHPRQEFPKED